MQFPLEIDFRNVDRSEALERVIEERLEKLDRFAPGVVRCKVTIESPHRHHEKGNLYHVRVDLHVPGAEIIINRDPGQDHAHEDPFVAVRDAVNAAARKLQDYGRITSSDGRLIYFHRNSLLDAALEDVVVGAEVRFDEEQGDKGPQATTVALIGKHHIVS